MTPPDHPHYETIEMMSDGQRSIIVNWVTQAEWDAKCAEVERLTAGVAQRELLLVEARLEASWWRHIAWINGYPRDSGDIHQWETIDEYRAVLNDEGWTTPHRPERATEGRQG